MKSQKLQEFAASLTLTQVIDIRRIFLTFDHMEEVNTSFSCDKKNISDQLYNYVKIFLKYLLDNREKLLNNISLDRVEIVFPRISINWSFFDAKTGKKIKDWWNSQCHSFHFMIYPKYENGSFILIRFFLGPFRNLDRVVSSST